MLTSLEIKNVLAIPEVFATAIPATFGTGIKQNLGHSVHGPGGIVARTKIGRNSRGWLGWLQLYLMKATGMQHFSINLPQKMAELRRKPNRHFVLSLCCGTEAAAILCFNCKSWYSGMPGVWSRSCACLWLFSLCSVLLWLRYGQLKGNASENTGWVNCNLIFHPLGALAHNSSSIPSANRHVKYLGAEVARVFIRKHKKILDTVRFGDLHRTQKQQQKGNIIASVQKSITLLMSKMKTLKAVSLSAFKPGNICTFNAKWLGIVRLGSAMKLQSMAHAPMFNFVNSFLRKSVTDSVL